MVTYKCNICNYNTNRKSNLNNHLKSKKHLSACLNQEDNFIDRKEKYETTINLLYKCEHCSKSFSENRYLNRHFDRCKVKKDKDIMMYKKKDRRTKQYYY